MKQLHGERSSLETSWKVGFASGRRKVEVSDGSVKTRLRHGVKVRDEEGSSDRRDDGQTLLTPHERA
jgi:hypothetical protein